MKQLNYETFYKRLNKIDKHFIDSDDFTMYYFIDSCNSENDFIDNSYKIKVFKKYKKTREYKRLKKLYIIYQLKNWYIYTFICGVNDLFIKLQIKAFFTFSNYKVKSLYFYTGNIENIDSFKITRKIKFNK